MVWGLGVDAVGAAGAFAYLAFVFPPHPPAGEFSMTRNLVALAIYLPLATTISSSRVRNSARALREWSASDRPPTELERRLVLRVPVINALWTGTFWAGGAVIFALVNLDHS